MTYTMYLQSYFVVNLSIGVACAIFFLLKYGIHVSKIPANPLHLQKCAQILLMISLAVPLVLLAVPRRTLPTIEFHAWTPAFEAASTVSKRPLRHSPKLEMAAVNSKATTNKNFAQLLKQKLIRLFRGLRSSIVLGLLIFGMIFYATQFFVKLQKLRLVLGSATLLRRVRHVSIVVSDSISVPFSALLFKTAWVVIPINILSESRDLKIALKHEFQHHRHGDTRWAFYVEVLGCLFYLNPAFFLLKRNITELQELACDEVLVTVKKISRYEYGRCLVRVAAGALKEHVATPFVASTSFAVSSAKPSYLKSFLGKRIEALAMANVKKSHGLGSILVMCISIAVTALFAYGAQLNFVSQPVSLINPGQAVTDPVIQKLSERILAKAIVNEGAKSGFVIVADPNTGRILAVANVDSASHKSNHWALSQMLEPASIAKTLVIAEALSKKLTTPLETHSCENGTYRYGGQIYHDWKKEGWASLSTEETITNSSDICSIKVGEKLGASGLREMLEDFGFGAHGTASEFAEARVGQLPPREDSVPERFVPHVSAGYGFRVTPLELVQAYGAIANGGYLMMPKGADEAGTQIVRRVLSTEASYETKKILEQVVEKGTAKNHANSNLYTTAGKTATSFSADLMKLEWMGGSHKANFAAFIGFAPVSEPKVEVFVAIRSPKSRDGAHGARHAAPVFREVVEEVLKQMRVASDKPSR